MVDRVVLEVLDELREVRELERRRPVRPEKRRDAGDEVVDVGHLGEDVVPEHEVGRASLLGQAPAESAPKNSVSVGTPRATAASATFRAGSMPSTGMPCGRKCWSR